jgi:hypothetical protein
MVHCERSRFQLLFAEVKIENVIRIILQTLQLTMQEVPML